MNQKTYTAAGVHGGSLGRWFEELCRLRYQRLNEVAALNGEKLRRNALPTKGGVYVFWWTQNMDLLNEPECNRDLVLHGPVGKDVALRIDDEWLGLDTELPIPLYVGKTAVGLNKRTGQHLMLSRERILPLGGGALKAKPPTTSCQLRAGIEHLFPAVKDTRSIVLENIGLSWVILDGYHNAVNRFYLEDMSIGLMRPPLNVDIEH